MLLYLEGILCEVPGGKVFTAGLCFHKYFRLASCWSLCRQLLVCRILCRNRRVAGQNLTNRQLVQCTALAIGQITIFRPPRDRNE